MTSSSIAQRIKMTLEQARTDTSVFKAHSTRGALVSVAVSKDKTTNGILQAADWSTTSIFQRFVISQCIMIHVAKPSWLNLRPGYKTSPLICEMDLLKYNFRMAKTMQWLHAIWYMKKSRISMAPPNQTIDMCYRVYVMKKVNVAISTGLYILKL